MFRRCLIILISLLCPILLSAQIPTSYEEAKKIGDAKLSVLQETNVPAEGHYVVLNKGWGWRFKKLLKYENTVYIVDNNYNLHGRIIDVPANSVLVFRRGNIRNGSLCGNDAKYSVIGDKTVRCNMLGTWERIAPLYTVSELGLRPNDITEADYNYTILKKAINNGLNLYIDGDYYVSFSKPLMLNYQLHIYGGNIVFSKHAFDLTDGGGIYADGVRFSSIEGTHTDDIVCGTREKHPAITTDNIVFINCHFSCNRVIGLEFEYTNPDIKPFGIKSLIVKNCYADSNARFLTLDAPYIEKCLFKNNTFTNFTCAPIYITHNHSARTHPNELGTNPWVEEIVRFMCDITIDSNIFIGKEISVNTYYCAAAIGGNKCSFTNNYLKDLINYSDKNSKGSSSYDAYLSCVDVDYENNYVENMMSYAKDGAEKPQTEIGKSKWNPLDSFSYKATRKYVNNVFVCDGSQFINSGVDMSSLYCNIFGNVLPVDTYVWKNNSVIYKNIILNGRTWSMKYGSFHLNDNYFECSKICDNLVFANSAYNCDTIDISRNTFKVANMSKLVVFNQRFDTDYRQFSHGVINISDNNFINSSPVCYYFIADSVYVKNNKSKNSILEGNLYLSDCTGNPRPLQVRSLDAEIALDANDPQGAIVQYFSEESRGTFVSSVTAIPRRGIIYRYQIGGKHCFKIVFYNNGAEQDVVFENDGHTCYYTFNGERVQLDFGQTRKKVWYRGNGIVFCSTFTKGESNVILTTLYTEGESFEGDYKLIYTTL